MPNTIQLRRSATASAVPTTTQLALGELAINTYDGRLYLKKNVSGTETIIEVGTIASGDQIAGGDLVSNFSSGDEGGQIRLSKSVTNTTLTTGITIDVYQNKLRIFETGGSARGLSIDLTTAANSAGSRMVIANASNDIDVLGGYFINPNLKSYTEHKVTNATTTGTVTLDLSTSNVFHNTLTGNTTFAFSNPPANTKVFSFTIITVQDATGGRTITWPTSKKFSGGSTPPPTTAANAVDVWSVMTYDGGTSYIVSLSVKDAK